MSDPASPMSDAPSGGAPADGATAPKVLLTVLDNGDGTFQLVEGDEADTGADGAAIAPGPGEEAPDKGATYDSLGALLKGVMDCVKKAQEGGDGTAEANFKAGFDGGSNASPPKSPVPGA